MPTKSSVREEFKIAYLKEFGIYDEVDIALWAAKWMVDYIKAKSKNWPNDDIICEEIEKLAKELCR